MIVQNEIRKFLIRNSIITYAMVIIAVASMIICYLTISKAIDESRKYVYLLRTDGEIVPLEWSERRENMAILIKQHLTMFVNNYYDLDQYNWEERTEKALWLGDLKAHYIKRKNDGYYNRFIQFGLEQHAVLHPENIELKQDESGKIHFYIIVSITEKITLQEAHNILFAHGTIRAVSPDFPKNPLGLYIEDYVEEKIVKDETIPKK